MKKIYVEEALGMKLCHDITKVVPGEFKGRLFKRNHIIRPEDIDELLNIGKEYIYVWEENIGEIHEDEAAVRIAKAVKGLNMTYAEPQEGKSIISSTKRGLFKVNSSLLNEINSLENISVTSLPNNFPVEEGKKLVGARIIPLVIKEEKIIEVENLCQAKGSVFEVKPYKKLRVGIIITGNEVYKGRIKDKFGPVLKTKMDYFKGQILEKVFCPDDITAIEQAIYSFIEKKADLIILTGGMSVDPDDLTPGAIRKTGAKLITYGVPVQPGNMFMMAYLNNTAIMGVPGAAIYFKTTILDVVLPRIFAGEILSKKDFIKMAEGGLCLNCKVCKYPNCYFCR